MGTKIFKGSHPEEFCIRDVLENFGKIQTPVPEPQSIFIKKRLGTGGFFCEFCKIFKSKFFYKTPLLAAF